MSVQLKIGREGAVRFGRGYDFHRYTGDMKLCCTQGSGHSTHNCRGISKVSIELHGMDSSMGALFIIIIKNECPHQGRASMRMINADSEYDSESIPGSADFFRKTKKRHMKSG